MQINHSHLVLDACCILNFAASGHFIEILSTIPAQVVITEVVKQKELLTLQRLSESDCDGKLQFDTAIQKGLLLVVDFESDLESDTFINYAFQIGDDGESATGAIAVHRDWAIATDDKRAIAFFQKEAPQLQIFSTLEIIKDWSETADLTPQQLRTALNAVRHKGRYIPHRNHLLLDWWQAAVR